jgi:hypothetical protein
VDAQHAATALGELRDLARPEVGLEDRLDLALAAERRNFNHVCAHVANRILDCSGRVAVMRVVSVWR